MKEVLNITSIRQMQIKNTSAWKTQSTHAGKEVEKGELEHCC